MVVVVTGGRRARALLVRVRAHHAEKNRRGEGKLVCMVGEVEEGERGLSCVPRPLVCDDFSCLRTFGMRVLPLPFLL